MIRVPDMLAQMNEWERSGSRVPFSITFVTCNLKENIGGEKITLAKALLVGSGVSKSKKKDPNHFANYTRNIRHVDSDRLIKVHVLCITRFNGMGVIL